MRRPAFALFAALSCLVAASAAQAYVSGPARPGDPLSGHRWYVDHRYGIWWEEIHHYGPRAAPLLRAADNPMTKSFGAYEPHPETGLRRYLERAQSEQP